MTGYLYHLYDADGDLLYLGCTKDIVRRLHEHRRTKDWWRWVTCIESTPMDHAIAWGVEQELIRRGYGGEYNVTQSQAARNGWGTRRAYQKYAHLRRIRCHVTACATCARRFNEKGDAQLFLPGMAFPSAICVQTPDGTYYVRTDKATWPELLAGREVRAVNVERAAARLAIYDASLEKVRGVMEADEALTVADAIEKMAAMA